MNKEEDYASDSDQSDEDFCPENAVADESDVSDVECDEEENSSSAGEENENSKRVNKKAKSNKVNLKCARNSKTKTENGRSTRQSAVACVEQNGRGGETHELESDEEAEKLRSDALWADFLGDAKKPEKHVIKDSIKEATNGKSAETPTSPPPTTTTTTKSAVTKNITVTEVLDFAGEAVTVHKTVNASDSIKENKDSKTSVTTLNKSSPAVTAAATSRTSIGTLKRTAGVVNNASGSGLGSILNQIGKKKKLSVLEKSQMDWKSFKKDEGIDEQLQTFNKGKNGYLERQDFLQRTDLRQFEIEKGMRQAKRQN